MYLCTSSGFRLSVLKLFSYPLKEGSCKTHNENFLMKLFYKKVSRVKGRMPLSLSADSETCFFLQKAQKR